MVFVTIPDICVFTEMVKSNRLIRVGLLPFFLVVPLLTKAVHADELSPFSTDGCSLFPDGSWCECCLAHDKSYWQGGTEEQRVEADKELEKCVTAVTGRDWLGSTMYYGVRFGGGPYWPTWYRWGYGWEYGRSYQTLSAEEQTRADQLLQQYSLEGQKNFCQ